MRRLATIVSAVALALLGLAAVALAGYREYNLGPEPRPKPDCPALPCRALASVTGFQVQQGRADGVSKQPARARRDGWVVAFTLTLGRPTKSQTAFFRKLYGRSAQARITILRPDPRRRNMNHRSVAQSETFTLDDYFGSRPTFALRRPLPVKKGEVIALTVPTWAPALATEQSKKEAWRGSRSPKDCENASQVGSHQKVGSVKSYRCLYTTARVLYTALVVHENRKTS